MKLQSAAGFGGVLFICALTYGGGYYWSQNQEPVGKFQHFEFELPNVDVLDFFVAETTTPTTKTKDGGDDDDEVQEEVKEKDVALHGNVPAQPAIQEPLKVANELFPNLFPPTWHNVPYVNGDTHGYDGHLLHKGFTPLQCRAWNNGSIELQGLIECYEGKDDCFLHKGWDFPSYRVAGKLPTVCTPSIHQHTFYQTEKQGVQFPGPPLLVVLTPTGELKIEIDPGSNSWTAYVFGVTQPGIGESNVKSVMATAKYEPKVVGTAIRPIPKRPIVAIVVPMTSRGLNLASVEKSPLFAFVVPSIKKLLVSDLNDYTVVVYAGFDATDPFWPTSGAKDTEINFDTSHSFQIKYTKCDCKSMVCNTNCVSKQAYTDGAEFFFRINDDSEFVKGTNFISVMVADLQAMKPPLVGVVGPSCGQGKLTILTHDFVHRTHLELFNMNYYPTILSNWWCDDWVSFVYGGDRTKQTHLVEILHRPRVSRYDVSYAIKESGEYNKILRETKAVVKSYLDSLR